MKTCLRSPGFPSFDWPFARLSRLKDWLKIVPLTLLASGLTISPVQAAVVITVYPANATIDVGTTRPFTAYVPMTPSTVQWLVNDVVGGSDAYGKISTTGVYVAPATVPVANTIVVKARSTANASIFGTVPVTILRKYPSLWSVSPAKVSVGSFQISLNGADFAPDSQVLINGVAVPTTYGSSTSLTASSMAAAVGTLQVSVRQPGLGTQTGNSVALSVVAVPVVVTVSPTSASVQLGASKTFTSTVTGSTNTAVSWSIVSGGGSITSSSGVYTAPAQMPASTAVTIRATSVASPSSVANATVTLTAPPPPPIIVTISPASTTVQLGGTKAFTQTVTGTANTAVTWSITSGGGSINASTGLYTAPATMPPSPSVTIRAVSSANSSSAATASLTLTAPPPPPVSLTAARFLEQTSFGPTPATLAAVTQQGIATYLTNQFAMPETVIPTPANNSMGDLRQWCLYNYTVAPDQLRQRVAYSLSQIIVTSSNKLIYPDAMLPWMRLLSKHAFGNYRNLLLEMSVCPSMGKYLDLANSSKPSVSGGANENYARELMQLFTIGLWQLNSDGSQKLDANGQPIPTYDQATVAQVALALTGWVYANNAYEDFTAPMVPVAARHDTTAKVILGRNFPAGQTVQQDLDTLIDTLMSHPNIAPFIATRLIRSLVKSNPSPEYIDRIAKVFLNNGNGVNGDLKAVITAILLDPEARNDVPDVNAGRLKEPILHVAGLLRALNGQFSPTHGLTYLFDYMAQPVLTPASVFSWFSPLYRLPGDPTLFGPEFQIYSPTDASLRGNFFFSLINYPATDMVVDLTPFQAYGNDMPGLVEAANQALLYGRMPAAMKQVLIDAATPGYDAKTRIETVLYLTALSGQYAVQY